MERGALSDPKAKSKLPTTPTAPQPRPWWVFFLVLLAANYLVMRAFFAEPPSVTVPYTFFKQQVIAGNVVEVTSAGDAIHGTFKTEVTYPSETVAAPVEGGSPDKTPLAAANAAKPVTSKQFKTQRPTFADPGLEELLEEKGVVVNALSETGPAWLNFLLGFGPTILLIGAFIWLSRRASSAAGGGIFGLGRSRAKRYAEGQQNVTFADVAGIDEAENELIEIVDFLKNPDKYQRLGGMMPKGVL